MIAIFVLAVLKKVMEGKYKSIGNERPEAFKLHCTTGIHTWLLTPVFFIIIIVLTPHYLLPHNIDKESLSQLGRRTILVNSPCLRLRLSRRERTAILHR